MKCIWYHLIIYNWKTCFFTIISYARFKNDMTHTRSLYQIILWWYLFSVLYPHALGWRPNMHKDTKCISMLLQERSFLFLTCWPYQISLQGLLLASSWARLRCCDSPPGSGTLHDVRRDPTGASHADVNAVPSVKRDEDYRDDGHVIHMNQF